MSTVRIYKVAELLGTTSQEVTALLKRDHGIEVKSASSTIEEVVARQFVDRLAKQRRITLPTGDIFAETPVQKGKKPAPMKKAPEPPKPAAPVLPPPRLVKTAKPVVAAAPVEAEPIVEEAPAPPPVEAFKRHGARTSDGQRGLRRARAGAVNAIADGGHEVDIWVGARADIADQVLARNAS